MSEKAKRNYPFRGKIYTAEQIDNIISGITFDGYTKEETDELLDLKQNVLTAGENISIVDDTISAVVTSPDWVLHDSFDWKNLFNKPDGSNEYYTKYDTVIYFGYTLLRRYYFIPKGSIVTYVYIGREPLKGNDVSATEIKFMIFGDFIPNFINDTNETISLIRKIVTINPTDNTITFSSSTESIKKVTSITTVNGIAIYYKP